jgi:hypothetical protein
VHCQSNVISNVLNYQWRRADGPLPSNAHTQNSVLTIRRLQESNAGVYLCVVRNASRKIEIPTILRVTSLVGRLNGPEAYALLSEMPIELRRSEIVVSFRPETADGLILYRSQHSQRLLQWRNRNVTQGLSSGGSLLNGDFIAIELVAGHVEVRFELGNGLVVLKSLQPLETNVWHHLHFTRLEQSASMQVDQQPSVTARSNGSSVGLDLNPLLFVGGFPLLFKAGLLSSSRQSASSTGMVGCISELRLDGRLINFWHEARETSGLIACDTCHTRRLQLARFKHILNDKQSKFDRITRARLSFNETQSSGTSLQTSPIDLNPETIRSVQQLNPCHNHGVCQETLSRTGQRCICSPGFSGDHCERFGHSCYPGACGSGRCVATSKRSTKIKFKLPQKARESDKSNRTIGEPSSAFHCDCPIGRTGSRCQNEISIGQPRFTGTRSFASYSIVKDSSAKLNVRMRIKPILNGKHGANLKDQLLLYSAERDTGFGDFFALVLRSGRLQLQFNTGSGIGIVSSDPLRFGSSSWLHVHVQRVFNEGRLVISGPSAMDQPAIELTYTGRAPGRTKGSSLRLPLFVGGVDEQMIQLPVSLQDLAPFAGCAGQVSVSSFSVCCLSIVF